MAKRGREREEESREKQEGDEGGPGALFNGKGVVEKLCGMGGAPDGTG